MCAAVLSGTSIFGRRRSLCCDRGNNFAVASVASRKLTSIKMFDAMMRFVGDASLARRMGAQSRRLAEAKYDVRQVNANLLRYAGLSC